MNTKLHFEKSAIALAALSVSGTNVMAQVQKFKEQANNERPNIVFVICEDLSSRLHCYGDEVARTPHIDALAKEGVRFTNVHTMAGVSGPSRSGLITGVFQNFTNMPNMRSSQYSGGPYFAVPQPDVKAYPELLRKSGYFTYCDVKFDYQFTTPTEPGAFSIFNAVEKGGYGALESHTLPPRWREYNLKGRPFYFNYNPQITHESGLFFSNDTTLPKYMLPSAKRHDQLRAMYQDRIVPTNPKKVKTKPFFMDTKASRAEIARFYDNIQVMDCQVGDLIANLKSDGLWDNTIFILTTDHGDCLPRSKRDIYDSGTRVPFIVHVPEKYRPTWLGANGTVNDRLISFEDIPTTLLSIAGIEIPSYMHGIDLSQDNPKEREYIFVNRTRQANAMWHSFGVQSKKYQYVRNFTDTPNGVSIAYRNVLATVKDLNKAHKEGKLPKGMDKWYAKRPVEEFYNLEEDPNQFHNLADNPAYKAEMDKFRKALDEFRDRGNDATLIPEDQLRAACVDADGKQKVTLQPVVTQDAVNGKVYITNLTDYASIGYSFDGKEYDLYSKALTVPVGVDKIYVKAVRYGWKECEPVVFTIK